MFWHSFIVFFCSLHDYIFLLIHEIGFTYLSKHEVNIQLDFDKNENKNKKILSIIDHVSRKPTAIRQKKIKLKRILLVVFVLLACRLQSFST